MARHYRTSSSRPIDYISRVNLPLMEKAVSFEESLIDDTLKTTGLVGSTANAFEFAPHDAEDAARIMQYYTQQTEDISKSILEDPVNWRKHLPKIRDLSKTLMEDMKTGEISKISQNYKSLKDNLSYIEEREKEYLKSGKGLSPEDARAAKAYIMKNFKGTKYDKNTKTFNMFKEFKPMDTMDISSVLGEGLDKLKASSYDFTQDHITPDGKYFNTITQSYEAVTPERIVSIVLSKLQDPRIQNYLLERQQILGIPGNNYFTKDEQGNISLIPPVVSTKRDYTEKELNYKIDLEKQLKEAPTEEAKEVIRQKLRDLESSTVDISYNLKTPLGGILKDLVDRNSYEKKKAEQKIRVNSIYTTKMTIDAANARHAETLANNLERDRLRREHEKEMFDKETARRLEEAKLKLQNSTSPKPGTTGVDKKTEPISSILPKTPIVSNLGLAPLDGEYVRTPGGEIKKYSLKGIEYSLNSVKSELERQKSKLAEAQYALANSNLTQSQRTSYQLNASQAYSDIISYEKELKDLESLYNNFIDLTIDIAGNLEGVDGKVYTKEDLEFYRDFKSRGGKIQDLEKELSNTREALGLERVKKNQESDITKQRAGFGSHAYVPKPDTEDALIKKINNIENKIDVIQNLDKAVDQQFSEFRKSKVFSDLSIIPTQEQSDAISSLIKSAPAGLIIYKQRGGTTEDIKLGRRKRMTFEGNSILDYIRDKDVKMTVVNIGPSLYVGDRRNPVVEVIFEDKNGRIPSNQSFFIPLNDEITSQLKSIVRSDDNKVREVLEYVTNDLTGRIANQWPVDDNVKVFPINWQDATGKNYRINIQKLDGHRKFLATFTTDMGERLWVPAIGSNISDDPITRHGHFTGIHHFVKSLEALNSGQLQFTKNELLVK